MKVNNKKCIRTLAWRSLKANRMRNLIAIIAIALTTTLFTTIFAIGGNMLESMQNATMRQVGTSSHGGLKYLTQEQYDNFAASPLIKDISYSIIIAGADNPELVKKQTEIRYAEDDFARWGFSYPTEGRMPQTKNELACSTITLDMLGIPHKLGEKVPLEFTVHGKSYREKFVLSGFWPGDDVMQATQVFLSREYTDSIIQVPESVNPASDFADLAGTISADVWFSNSIGIEGKMEQLLLERGYSLDEIYIGVNWAYLSSGELDITTFLMVLFLVLLILLSGYLIIYSIFAISVTGDIQFYGLLKTIGATGRQLRRVVRSQALALSVLGIPLGLLCGFLLGYLLTPFVAGITALGSDSKTSVNPFIFVFSILFSLVTVFISCLKPGRMAAKVSPIEAVRFTQGGKGNKKLEKKSRKVNPATMAWANVKRTPAKLFLVVVSLALSLVLMNSVYSIVQGFDMEEYLKNQMVSDFSVADHSLYSAMIHPDNLEGVDPDVLTGIANLPGLEDSANIYFMESYRHKLTPEAWEGFKQTYKEMEPRLLKDWSYMEEIFRDAIDTGEIPLHIYGLQEMALTIGAKDQTPVDYNKLASGNYALISHIEVDYDQEYPTMYKIGDKIPLENGEGEIEEFEIIGYYEYPYVLSCAHSHMINSDLVLADTVYQDFYGERQPMLTIFDVDEAQLENTESWLTEYCETGNQSLDYRSREFYREEFTAMQTTYMVCGGALAFILALIGLLNFINTNVTSIYARRRELAMLQSVGMTGRQLRTMLFCEGGIYGVLTILFAVTVGSLISWGIIKGIAGNIWFFNWHFTILPLLLAILPLIAVCIFVPALCYRFMQRESVVDRLRQE